ncbi:MAG: hypothetical protein PVH19_07835 [Planctomycetia bacterium]|jgi:MinD-like ATPase involved in chromosome partitioning or flagellar assembly
MSDQASELRQLVRESLQKQDRQAIDQPRVVLVAGGRAGAGSTSVAMNLAATLAQLEYQTLLVDADQAGFDSDLAEKIDVSLLDLEREDDEPPVEAAAAVRVSSQGMEYVVVDAGKVVDRSLWQIADLILVVTTSELPVVMESYSLLKQMITGGVLRPIHILVNMSDEVTAADVFGRLDRAGQEFLGFRPSRAGHLSVSGELLASNQTFDPIVLRSPQSILGRQIKELTLWSIDQMLDRSKQLSRPRHPEESAA